ncbi:transcriptional pleiotropic repressor [Sporomusaceae bacterium BoRhaA]|uniref:GTP-sensing pleiotropic transcriptional regulator CodY n=1 Tax=Pelorhabdus rhamnosifermentans TaxID=2772457 RepID=UPI001C05F5E6|nr:GTP-sensing pleiotropic transcriptional regulator CodY [Pelorhabdus rhamnosifermentans]MBU2702020.1 transcriptional pleiotropic repressor [Pelorhabdus rhamnosifermentans]
MLTLLERTRKINKLLQKSEKVAYKEMSNVLSTVMSCNVYIVSKEGNVLGYALLDNFECEIMKDRVLNLGVFPERYVEWLQRIAETSPNIRLESGLCAFADETECFFHGKVTTIVPIHGGGDRLGTLIVAKFDQDFTDEDLILSEYGGTVVGMEILRDLSEKNEEEARKKATVQVAIGTLSYSELEAILHILGELQGNEGLLVASKIADRVGITRSLIVNALRKFESAGVIESKSLGMKGTYIKVLNDRLLDELKKLRK